MCITIQIIEMMIKELVGKFTTIVANGQVIQSYLNVRQALAIGQFKAVWLC